jgi:putative FmdB family regulatory protein
MPTYQYVCTNPQCGNEFELVQSFTDPAASECPVCGQPVRKRYGSVGVVFKGSGFYRTDSRSESKSSTTASSASSTPSTSSNGSDSGTSATKSDTAAKPATGSGSGSSGKVAASA